MNDDDDIHGPDEPLDGNDPEVLTSIKRLTQDLKTAARTLSDREARFFVDAYYAMQRDRIRAKHQDRTLSESVEPHSLMTWLSDQRHSLERQVARALDAYSAGKPIGQWARSIVGIGPIISAGFLAHIYMGEWCVFRYGDRTCHGRSAEDCQRLQADPRRQLIPHDYQPVISCPTAGHVWRYAGLDPTVKWEKGVRRPWNASLKRLCYLLGESFVKVQRHPRDVYGKVFIQRKVFETAKNERGDYAAQAAQALVRKNFGKHTEARAHYESGHLPPAQIHMRSMRYAVKLFLAHYHHVLFEMTYQQPPPKPYVIEHMEGHTHFVAPPNWH